METKSPLTIVMSFASVVIVTGLSLQAHADVKNECKRLDLAEGKAIEGTSFKFGDSKLFIDEQNELSAFELLNNGKSVHWINQGHLVSERIFVKACREESSRPDWFDTRNGAYGSCNHAWSYLNSGKTETKAAELKLAGYDWISNSTVCGESLAYYSTKKVDKCKVESSFLVEGVVFDLKDLKESKRVDLGCVVLMTDNEGHFPAPEWSAGHVTFEPEPNKKTKVSVELN